MSHRYICQEDMIKISHSLYLLILWKIAFFCGCEEMLNSNFFLFFKFQKPCQWCVCITTQFKRWRAQTRRTDNIRVRENRRIIFFAQYFISAVIAPHRICAALLIFREWLYVCFRVNGTWTYKNKFTAKIFSQCRRKNTGIFFPVCADIYHYIKVIPGKTVRHKRMSVSLNKLYAGYLRPSVPVQHKYFVSWSAEKFCNPPRNKYRSACNKHFHYMKKAHHFLQRFRICNSSFLHQYALSKNFPYLSHFFIRSSEIVVNFGISIDGNIQGFITILGIDVVSKKWNF